MAKKKTTKKTAKPKEPKLDETLDKELDTLVEETPEPFPLKINPISIDFPSDYLNNIGRKINEIIEYINSH